ncbi:MAG: biotin--[acetyl-CoA-carboxylase] ligase [Ignavibacteria bacterium]|nr:biotin--[acetyl-CoA-carboxylase] ligase [Ignavibacteria bacterium]
MNLEPKYKHHAQVNSTNDAAFEMLKENDCIVVTADFQNNGRGRNKKKWLGNKNENLFYTFGINHQIIEIPVYMFQIIGGLAAFYSLNSIKKNSANFRLKYPNDVYANGKKIAGIISESNVNQGNCSSIIGIGINNKQVEFSDEIAENAISLILLGIEINTSDLVELLTDNIIKMLGMNYNEIFELWKVELNLNNKEIKIISEDKNENYYLKNFLEDGRLILISENGDERIINNGDSIRYKL